MTGIPVALSNNHVPSVAKNKKVTIIGGINSVNAKPENSVRWSGKNRYRTSLEVAKGGYKNPSTVILASGEKYADALSASNIANRYNAPLLLMSKNSMDSEIISYIKTNINRVIVVGGEDSITNKVLQVLGGDIGNIEKPETKPEEKPTPPNTNNIEELKKYELGTLSEAQAWKLYEATPTPNPATDPAYLSMLEDGPKGVRFGHNEIKVVSGNEFIGKMPDGTYRKESYIVEYLKPLPYEVLVSNGMNRNLNELMDLDLYLQLPENESSFYIQSPQVSITDRTRDLTKTIVKDINKDYEKAIAIQNYLRDNYKYNLDVPQLPKDQEFVDHFLFETKFQN